MSSKETFSAGQTREFYGDGDFFRLLQTTAGINVEFFYQGREVAEMIDVEAGYAESFARDKLRFDRIRIYSATAQNVKWVIREGSDVRYDRGAASITGVVGLDAPTLAALEFVTPRPDIYAPQAPIVLAAGSVTLLAPGANTGGYLIQDLQARGAASAGGPGTFLAKASAPASLTDGDGLGVVGFVASAANNPVAGRVQNIVVPAGKGIYFYGSAGSVYTATSFATLVGKAL